MNAKKLLKASNSKGQLVKAILVYQRALSYYANESHWAVKGEDIIWVKDDDPTLPAQTVLGMRKQSVREPDKKMEASNEEIRGNFNENVSTSKPKEAA